MIDPARRQKMPAAAFGEILRAAANRCRIHHRRRSAGATGTDLTDADESGSGARTPVSAGHSPWLSDYARTGQARSGKRTTRRAHRHDFARRHSLARQCRGNESSTASGQGQGQSWP